MRLTVDAPLARSAKRSWQWVAQLGEHIHADVILHRPAGWAGRGRPIGLAPPSQWFEESVCARAAHGHIRTIAMERQLKWAGVAAGSSCDATMRARPRRPASHAVSTTNHSAHGSQSSHSHDEVHVSVGQDAEGAGHACSAQVLQDRGGAPTGLQAQAMQHEPAPPLLHHSLRQHHQGPDSANKPRWP